MTSPAHPLDPASREAVARREIGRTEIARPLRWLLAVTCAVTVGWVPATELVLGTDAGPGAFLRDTVSSARSAFDRDGSITANRAVLAQIEAYEDRLDESSVVAAIALPPVQGFLTRWLGVGNEQALVGRDGWLFYRPAIELLTGPPFLDEAALEARVAAAPRWEEPPSPDPRPAVLRFRDDLQARGIELVVLPVPVKASVHPRRFAARAAAGPHPIHNPSWQPWLEELRSSGVRVVDLSDVLSSAPSAPERFLARDTHWAPESVDLAAMAVADELERLAFLSPRRDGSWWREVAEATSTGDLVEMLRLPEDQTLFPPQTVELRTVVGDDGRRWKADQGAEVLVLGDSFTNVFSTPELGWGQGAGLAEQLAFHLQRPVDRIAVNAGGALGARERLVSLLASGRERLASTRVVVWEMSARELAHGDWRPTPLPDGGSEPELPESHLTDGFVVWESNRTGDWRLWARRFGESEPRQVSPDEPGLQHCCPHVSPDGTKIVYLARTPGKDQYPEVEVPGTLRLLSTDDWTGRTLVDGARSYGWGNRAAVWRDDQTIVYVDGQGRTAELDLATGASRLLVPIPREELGWLVDSTLRVATHAAPVFAPFDEERRTVAVRESFGGCEPYFTHDGRWGYWVAGAGGPLNRIDLGSREVQSIVDRNDPRLDPARRYLYFAMTSRDSQLLAWGASDGTHSHFTADYDVYVAPIDPETLELVGRPVRVTDHPATDRYPDAFLAPLPLGRHRGEAPFTVTLAAPESAEWAWRSDGRTLGRGAQVTAAFERPGAYRVEATSGERTVEGLVVVDRPTPPEVLGLDLRDDMRWLDIRFSEPVDTAAAVVELDPPELLGSWWASDDRRSVRVELDGDLGSGARVRLQGVTDLAGRPNPLPGDWLEVEPPTWPADRKGLVFLWEADDRSNLVVEPSAGTETAFPLERGGRAWIDHRFALRLDGGSWRAPERAASEIVDQVVAHGEITVEATLTPDGSVESEEALLSLLDSRDKPLIALSQDGHRLVLRLATSEARGAPPIVIGRLEAGVATHVVVSYAPARLRVLVDGELVEVVDSPTGHLNRWRSGRLVVGNPDPSSEGWRGSVEGIAIWSRFLDDDVALDEAPRYRRVRSGRPDVAISELELRLTRRSQIPTLAELSPYREALVAFEWEVVAGRRTGERVRVVHWAWLDGERQPAADWRVGHETRLRLEPFEDNPQLEPYVLADSIGGDPTLWFEAGSAPSN